MLHALLARKISSHLSSLDDNNIISSITDEWFPEQRKFYEDRSQLVAAIKGRRAGGTKGGCAHFVRMALSNPGTMLLYINSTREEARRLAWYGLKDDGIAALCSKYKLEVNPNETRLEIRFSNGSLILLKGADDESELRKALGFAYHEVWWDEAQKIPPKLAPAIREVLMPAMLDFGGRLRLVGTPVRQMSGLFYEVTKPPSHGDRMPGWSVHNWNLLDNTFFGNTREERWERGMVALQNLFGGEVAAPMDSPIMQREGFGNWVREDASYVYSVHKVPRDKILYAKHRNRSDGFVDIQMALSDLPFPKDQGFYSLGADLGYNDPFAVVLWAWHRDDPVLYEVFSWKMSHLTSDEQVKFFHEIQKNVSIGQIVCDAAALKSTVRGWSKEWVERYGLPILEAEKQHKNTAIKTMNSDILSPNGPLVRMRDGGPLMDEMSQIMWMTLVSGSGREVEDPSIPNDTADAGLYSHRHSYQYRHIPKCSTPGKGTLEYYSKIAKDIESEVMDDLYGNGYKWS